MKKQTVLITSAVVIGVIAIIGGAWLLSPERPKVSVKPDQEIVEKTDFSLEVLKNSSYTYAPGTGRDGEIQQFSSGSTAVTDDKGTRSWSTIYKDAAAFGDLNHDGSQDAAVVVQNILDASATGGSGGNELTLNAVASHNGDLSIIAHTSLGLARSVDVHAVTIRDGIILVDLTLNAFSSEPAPSRETWKYKLQGNELVRSY